MLDIIRQPRIAVIDDDADFSMSLATLLGSDGFDVQVFGSAESFIAADQVQRFCCLMVDWLLPGMSGATFCQRLSALGRHPTIILMSGTQFLGNGGPGGLPSEVEFIKKPFDPEWLLARLSDIWRGPL